MSKEMQTRIERLKDLIAKERQNSGHYMTICGFQNEIINLYESNLRQQNGERP
jgi:hypothetical protein